MSPSRCTQNATFGDEWRRGWHPERFAKRRTSARVLVVGAGPAGLEAARVAAMRGYEVALAESEKEFGGRVSKERRLPGLSAWGRVADYRNYQLSQLANVQAYRNSLLSAEDILSFGFEHIALATGSRWRADSIGRFNLCPIRIAADASVFTPDDLMEGKIPGGRVVIYDDDHYYMASVLAELLLQAGARVMIVTPSSMVSNFTQLTLEQKFIQRRLLEAGAALKLTHGLAAVAKDHVKLACIYTGRPAEVEADAIVMVTARLPNERLYRGLKERQREWAEHGVRTVTAIGDCLAPGTIAHAVYSGHRFGRELDEPASSSDMPYRREVTQLARDYPRVFP